MGIYTAEDLAKEINKMYQIKHFAVAKVEDGIEFTWKIQHGRELRTYTSKIDKKCVETAWWIMALENIAQSMRKASNLLDCEITPMNDINPITGLPTWITCKTDMVDKRELAVQIEDEDFVGSDIK